MFIKADSILSTPAQLLSACTGRVLAFTGKMPGFTIAIKSSEVRRKSLKRAR
jgi:hypothetical protein